VFKRHVQLVWYKEAKVITIKVDVVVETIAADAITVLGADVVAVTVVVVDPLRRVQIGLSNPIFGTLGCANDSKSITSRLNASMMEIIANVRHKSIKL
jgi:hypothetical protein